jgi:hypothetical protein
MKPVHMGAHVNGHGDVSALCYATSRAINLKTATWTNRREAVTCPRCLEVLARNPEKS